MSDPRAGFTLIEALAALTVLAAGLVLIQQIYSNGARAQSMANRMNAALWLADEQMALGLAAPLAPGVDTGDDGNGLQWQRSTRLVAPSEVGVHGLWLVEVEVTSSDLPRKTRLATLRSGPVSDKTR